MVDATADHVMGAMEKQEWEHSKGSLRALVRIIGSYPADLKDGKLADDSRFTVMDELVKEFIAEVEAECII
jgi:hypothetical protein